jgi:hypothetical protein
VGVGDYPPGVTLSNVTALLQHLMQYPISNHFYSFSKARYQNTITTSLQGKLTTRFIYLQAYERGAHPQRHVHPLMQSPLVSFLRSSYSTRIWILQSLFMLTALGNAVLISVKQQNVVRYAMCLCYCIL